MATPTGPLCPAACSAVSHQQRQALAAAQNGCGTRLRVAAPRLSDEETRCSWQPVGPCAAEGSIGRGRRWRRTAREGQSCWRGDHGRPNVSAFQDASGEGDGACHCRCQGENGALPLLVQGLRAGKGSLKRASGPPLVPQLPPGCGMWLLIQGGAQAVVGRACHRREQRRRRRKAASCVWHAARVAASICLARRGCDHGKTIVVVIVVVRSEAAVITTLRSAAVAAWRRCTSLKLRRGTSLKLRRCRAPRGGTAALRPQPCVCRRRRL